MLHIYNLKKSKLDGTEKVFESKKYAAITLPESFDLRPKCPEIYNQGNQGSCTANAGCAARSLLAEDPSLYLSRAFLYYMERFIEGDTDKDAGASMKDISVAMEDYGVCLDSLMPYDDRDFTTEPTERAMREARTYKITGASMVNGVDGIKTALVVRNQPVLCGMTVYESMESRRVEETGVLPMPKEYERILGGHAVDIVGYLPSLSAETIEKLHPFLTKEIAGDMDKSDTCIEKLIEEILNIINKRKASGYFIVRNSWGEGWGDKGYFYMPYEYVKRGYADEFWILEN